MSMKPTPIRPVPEETARVARAAFPKGNRLLRMRDELGVLYNDPMFAALYASQGQAAIAPWRLALVTVMQFVENLSDRQAAESVRSRIDWKYVLGLDLTDPGFDFSVLSEFRARLIRGGQEQRLLEAMLTQLTEQGLLKARGQHRTDSTHVLACVRTLNRLESVGETLRAALNSLATAAPDWLAQQSRPEWLERYARRVEEYRLPKGEAARQELGEAIGADGHALLAALYAPEAPFWLRQLPAVQILRVAWIHQFYLEADRVKWRKAADLPPASLRFDSPYDREAHYGAKRNRQSWTGYKVHLTEVCDAETPNLIVDVQTTAAGIADVSMTASIQAALASKDLVPDTHLVDAGYIDAELLVTSSNHGIALIGPVHPDVSWQAKAGQGFDIPAFTIDWEAKQAICPTGQTSVCWCPGKDNGGNDTIHIVFSRTTCLRCPSHQACTHSETRPRVISVRPQAQHEALQQARQVQKTEAWQARYAKRAGVEGCISQAVRAFGLRHCRYFGLAKTGLQHVLEATAINIVRLDAWFTGKPRAQTRQSSFAKLASLRA